MSILQHKSRLEDHVWPGLYVITTLGRQSSTWNRMSSCLGTLLPLPYLPDDSLRQPGMYYNAYQPCPTALMSFLRCRLEAHAPLCLTLKFLGNIDDNEKVQLVDLNLDLARMMPDGTALRFVLLGE